MRDLVLTYIARLAKSECMFGVLLLHAEESATGFLVHDEIDIEGTLSRICFPLPALYRETAVRSF